MNLTASNLPARKELQAAVQNETFIGRQELNKEHTRGKKAGWLLQGYFFFRGWQGSIRQTPELVQMRQFLIDWCKIPFLGETVMKSWFGDGELSISHSIWGLLSCFHLACSSEGGVLAFLLCFQSFVKQWVEAYAEEAALLGNSSCICKHCVWGVYVRGCYTLVLVYL